VKDAEGTGRSVSVQTVSERGERRREGKTDRHDGQ
jgi:hypothetical protein